MSAADVLALIRAALSPAEPAPVPLAAAAPPPPPDTPHAALLADLRRDEGLRLKAYPDPLSGGVPFTIGYGHTGPNIHPGVVWTLEQAEAALLADVVRVIGQLRSNLSWFDRLDSVRQDVLANMAYNMGWGNGASGLSAFRNTLAKVQAGDWGAAAAGMLASRWAAQVQGRAHRLAAMMLTGVRAG